MPYEDPKTKEVKIMWFIDKDGVRIFDEELQDYVEKYGKNFVGMYEIVGWEKIYELDLAAMRKGNGKNYLTDGQLPSGWEKWGQAGGFADSIYWYSSKSGLLDLALIAGLSYAASKLQTKASTGANVANVMDDLKGTSKGKIYVDNIGSQVTLEEYLKYNPENTLKDYELLIKEQSPWLKDFIPVSETLKSGDTLEIALSQGQPINKPGNFATESNTIPSIDSVRENLAVKQEWKPTIDRVVEYRVKVGVELPVKSGPVGPQIDLVTDKYLSGGANQFQIDVPNQDIMKYLEIVSVKTIK
ncbi:hypothetical protein [Pseudolactococcus hodotermopsidis]|nr:hypothetical protein [Lactococcus hodotermopsidis]